jgi:hypothetical protein
MRVHIHSPSGHHTLFKGSVRPTVGDMQVRLSGRNANSGLGRTHRLNRLNSGAEYKRVTRAYSALEV